MAPGAKQELSDRKEALYSAELTGFSGSKQLYGTEVTVTCSITESRGRATSNKGAPLRFTG